MKTIIAITDHPQTNSFGASDKFESSGLCIETLFHYKCLRVTFIGLLKEINTNIDTAEDEANRLRFVKFNFL